MSRGKYSGKKQTKNLADVTINDFANATVCTNRFKKGAQNVNTTINSLNSDEADDKDWDDKTDEFDGEFVKTENEDGTVSYAIKKQERRRRKITTESSDDKTTSGNDYPLDIWYLISKYIGPEDIGRFAGICKMSYAVVSRSQFWIDLYNIYYTNIPALPDDLTPAHLQRRFGVRSATIRALFFIYKPFSDRILNMQPSENQSDVAKKRRCIQMWHRKYMGSRWGYYFKLQDLKTQTYRARLQDLDLIEALDDVFANPDENCKILVVKSFNFYAIPPVLGYVLIDVVAKLAPSLRQYRLNLKFSLNSYYAGPKVDGSSCIDIVLDEVINYKVLDWWHPQYPRSNTLEILWNRD